MWTNKERLTKVVIEVLWQCFEEASLGYTVEKYGKASFGSKKYPGPVWEGKNLERFSKRNGLAYLVPFSDEIREAVPHLNLGN